MTPGPLISPGLSQGSGIYQGGALGVKSGRSGQALGSLPTFQEGSLKLSINQALTAAPSLWMEEG